jgi:hypothetical protein
MRRFVITSALFSNALATGLMLFLLLLGDGWNEPASFSANTVQFVVIVSAVAFVLNLVLAPVVGLSFWARDRGTRRLEARLDTTTAQTSGEIPTTIGGKMSPIAE